MRIFVFIAIAACSFYSCNKSNGGSNTPPLPSVAVDSSIRLYHSDPIDTVGDWVRIGRVTRNLNDLCFVSATDGFIIDENFIYTTHDKGMNWVQIQTSAPNDLLFNIQFIDSQNGFVQGSKSLKATQDGGLTWISKSLPTNSAFYFQFISLTTGFFADSGNGIQKTLDAGDHWVAILPKQTSVSYPFYFLDSLRGFSMSDNHFNVTTDGGKNWIQKSNSPAVYAPKGYFRMQFLDILNGYCATPNGLFKSSDGGATWTNCLPATSIFMVPYFFDKNNGYCIEGGTIYKTTDAGLHWQISCKLSAGSFCGFSFQNMNTGWAATFEGYILRLK